MDRLLSMRVFQAVADEGGFAAAARKLDLATSVVTRLVIDLETFMGVRLFQRTTRRVALTPAGEAYLARLRSILGDIDEAHALAQSESREMSGTLRILCWPVFANEVVAPAAVEFQQRHPAVRLVVQADSVADPNVEDFDVCLMLGAVHLHPSVVVRTIVQGQGFLCAAPAYLDAHGRPRAPEDLRQHRFLRAAQAARPGPLRLLEAASENRSVQVDVQPVLTTNSIEMVMRMALAGGGIGAIPGLLAYRALQDGRLERVLPAWITGRPAVIAALPSRKFLPARTRAFLDHLAEFTERMRVGSVAPAAKAARAKRRAAGAS